MDCIAYNIYLGFILLIGVVFFYLIDVYGVGDNLRGQGCGGLEG